MTNNIIPKSKHIFKAIYKKKYLGFFYLEEKTVQVVNYFDPNDIKVASIKNCDIFAWTGTIAKNKGLLFENDIISNPKQELGIIVFKDCRFMVQYSKTKFTVLTDSIASKCCLEGDSILDKDLICVVKQIKASEDPICGRDLCCSKKT